MEQVLRVNKLCKQYPKFQLTDVTFSVEKGQIMGFIGRNGAGKTTTLKTLLNLVHPVSGNVEFFGMSFAEHEREIKQRIGYATGGVSYYARKKIREIAAVTKTFYPNWDDGAYRRYLGKFGLDEEKKLIELSEGMKVKFNLTLALSHHAEFLLLDEPTSGLDPVSREELLEIFLDIAAEGVAILFSTHITSDLDKCADAITYIQNGRIVASEKTADFVEGYRLLTAAGIVPEEKKKLFLGTRRSKDGMTALIRRENAEQFAESELQMPDLETIMVHLEKNPEGNTAEE